MLGLGAGMGYVAAKARLDVSRTASAAKPSTSSPKDGDHTEGKSRCSEKASRNSVLSSLTTGLVVNTAAQNQSAKKPNINRGIMGYRTPNSAVRCPTARA